VLRQRNTLLKSARASGVRGDQLSTLDIWDERLVTLGSELIEARGRLVAELLPEVTAAYIAVAGADHHATLTSQLTILGATNDEDGGGSDAHAESAVILTAREAAEKFRESLARVRRSEIDRATTLIGPHRDDLVLQLNGMPARGYASHGESWSFALALKLASAQVLRRESTTGDPVLMLDDVFAELDQSRRGRLAGAVADFEQVLITAAVFDDVPEGLAGHTVRIRQGKIVDE
jgi:DNA replication and repair protein RecF